MKTRAKVTLSQLRITFPDLTLLKKNYKSRPDPLEFTIQDLTPGEK
jgi:hypothetical protein